MSKKPSALSCCETRANRWPGKGETKLDTPSTGEGFRFCGAQLPEQALSILHIPL